MVKKLLSPTHSLIHSLTKLKTPKLNSALDEEAVTQEITSICHNTSSKGWLYNSKIIPGQDLFLLKSSWKFQWLLTNQPTNKTKLKSTGNQQSDSKIRITIDVIIIKTHICRSMEQRRSLNNCIYWKNEVTPYCNVFLLPIETHANVIPQWTALRSLHCCNAIFYQRNIVISMQLKHATSGQDCLHISRLKCHWVSEMFKCHLILAFLQTTHQRSLIQ